MPNHYMIKTVQMNTSSKKQVWEALKSVKLAEDTAGSAQQSYDAQVLKMQEEKDTMWHLCIILVPEGPKLIFMACKINHQN